jgi:hypothetical protein
MQSYCEAREYELSFVGPILASTCKRHDAPSVDANQHCRQDGQWMFREAHSDWSGPHLGQRRPNCDSRPGCWKPSRIQRLDLLTAVAYVMLLPSGVRLKRILGSQSELGAKSLPRSCLIKTEAA